MKTILTLVVVAVCTFGSYAQTSDAEADAIINLLHVQKAEVIQKLVPVSGKDSVAFWKIYNEYQAAVKPEAKARIRLYERTAQAYQKMTAARADSLAQQYFANRTNQEKILEVYYKKIKTATNGVIAFEFYQAEIYLLTQIRASIMQQIPTYGELQSVAKRN